jgi:hypothetical protein
MRLGHPGRKIEGIARHLAAQMNVRPTPDVASGKSLSDNAKVSLALNSLQPGATPERSPGFFLSSHCTVI